ncbi:MAG: hypothetical protein GQ570_03655 [Helicobacteraceae bacterium]|nr:hypothetical protein [Helicobacteraceae bacterium]
MVRVKCVFNHEANNSKDNTDYVGEFRFFNKGEPDYPYEDSVGMQFSQCRLAQGEKTPYEGKGQPVPDGVMVEAWGYKNGRQYYRSRRCAENTVWNLVDEYQIQEQPPEEKQSRTTIPEGTVRVVNAVTGEETKLSKSLLVINEITFKPIEVGLLGRAIARLKNELTKLYMIKADLEMVSWSDPNFLKKLYLEIEDIESLIKELDG